MDKISGMSYAPSDKPDPVCKKGEFVFAVIALDHDYIYGMCNGLTEAGGTLKYVYDPDRTKSGKACPEVCWISRCKYRGHYIARS